ncbi:ComEC/Rec2 family competence protein [Aliivibrio fischeri]|uniref:ComEC/Rec2 family competence protein n=1 Tax=Aliivibrio fischeri TaxID=668 RepID=UPI00084C7FB6|nr:MBL fold metallo-hydrolase [Aliivibrio fischeri]OED53391.1 MBL fold metallo-hydrolase [Aliivibrio fischeri]
MSFTFTAFKAYHGDSFLLSTPNSHILIDGGTANTYGQIIDKINDVKLNAIVVTHVDYDHIGGIINLINDDSIDVDECDFYMNHPDLAVTYQGEKVAYKHGDSLNELIKKKNKTFIPLHSCNEISIGDFNILVLSPLKKDLNTLHKNWNASKIIEDGELRYLSRQINNGDIINKSSIAFIASLKNQSVLFLGDSNPQIICNNLKNIGYSINNPINLSMLKLSHHGSQHNTNKELLEIINCSNYYISTNGGNYNHPDKETIKLLSDRTDELNTTFNIYLNYDIEDDIRSRCNFKFEKLNFIYKNDVSSNELN